MYAKQAAAPTYSGRGAAALLFVAMPRRELCFVCIFLGSAAASHLLAQTRRLNFFAASSPPSLTPANRGSSLCSLLTLAARLPCSLAAGPHSTKIPPLDADGVAKLRQQSNGGNSRQS